MDRMKHSVTVVRTVVLFTRSNSVERVEFIVDHGRLDFISRILIRKNMEMSERFDHEITKTQMTQRR